MRGKVRPEPVIPDHEVLRKIGGGSYGEVWLARGVTGAMRAVKLVRREDFEDEIGFEREFEGILKYEPISRDHPGLVNILHVGRSEDKDDGEFYYYVMELGDDVHEGKQINPVEYEPRNLRTDMKKAGGTPIDPDLVIDVGLRLSEALTYLHEKGLAHRDIKPSNIIFVDGKAKLADIGLVAARGQRTFVGTEGFVPPEGPGSARADVYGLGKVLYEMASGKDRLEFPELPDSLPESANRKRWRALNQIICEVCEPRASKRGIRTAKNLSIYLTKLKRGQRVKPPGNTMVPLLFPLALVCLASIAWVIKTDAWRGLLELESPGGKPIERTGFIKVQSDPQGAEVYDVEGKFLGITPLTNITMAAGDHYEFEFRLEGYRVDRMEGTVVADKTTVVEKELSIYAPPVAGEEWSDHFGLIYQPVENYHISAGYVRRWQWNQFERETNKKYPVQELRHSESGVTRTVVLTSPEAAADYCDWQTRTSIQKGYLDKNHYISPRVARNFNPAAKQNHDKAKRAWPFYAVVKEIPYARIDLDSDPSGASVQLDGEDVGVTPLSLENIKPGVLELTLSLEGYRKQTRKIRMPDHGDKEFRFALSRNNSVVFGQNWENSLGMKFVPVGEGMLVSAWETRRGDYALFLKETKGGMFPDPGFEQGPDHPVVNVSRDDAVAFCQWLTLREEGMERISQEEEYRLLTDLEWSRVAGLEENPDYAPSRRELRIEKTFPWGRVWPPEDAGSLVGNLADKTASKAEDVPRDATLLDYNDNFEKTSPVGSFPPNKHGVYDLAGNAAEWVSDNYAEDGEYGVLRGGSWRSYLAKHLYLTSRNAVRPTKTADHYGFRVVLSKKNLKMTAEEPRE